jgi:hypothetical protein
MNRAITPPQTPEEDFMLRSVAAYLETIGWRALVIGTMRIQQEDRTRHNFEFVVRFTGGRIAEPVEKTETTPSPEADADTPRVS